jgi:prephenate dehydrogenase
VAVADVRGSSMTDSGRAIGIVGSGRVAQALGRLLADAGEPVVAVAGRNAASVARAASFIGSRIRPAAVTELPSLAGRILVAVADDAIEAVAQTLAASGMREGSVLHTSGVHDPTPLHALSDVGVSCGVLHPLQTVATPERGVGAHARRHVWHRRSPRGRALG